MAWPRPGHYYMHETRSTYRNLLVFSLLFSAIIFDFFSVWERGACCSEWCVCGFQFNSIIGWLKQMTKRSSQLDWIDFIQIRITFGFAEIFFFVLWLAASWGEFTSDIKHNVLASDRRGQYIQNDEGVIKEKLSRRTVARQESRVNN